MLWRSVAGENGETPEAREVGFFETLPPKVAAVFAHIAVTYRKQSLVVGRTVLAAHDEYADAN